MFLFLVDMLFMYLSCFAFPAICGARYLTDSACKNKLIVVVVVLAVAVAASIQL